MNFSFMYVLHVGKARQPNLVSGELMQVGNSPSTQQTFDFFQDPKTDPSVDPQRKKTPPLPRPPLQQNYKVTLYFCR